MKELFVREAIFPPAGRAEAYPFPVPALQRAGKVSFTVPVTFLAGENGAGKSTLLEGLAAALGIDPEGGSRNYLFSGRNSPSVFGESLRLVRGARRPKDGFFLRAESFYNTANQVGEYDGGLGDLLDRYGGDPHQKSHGESFLALIQHRFGEGIYLLDEPEAALSPARQLVLLCELDRLAKNGSQLIIATHSPILMAFPGAEILWMDETGIALKQWKETDHYRLTHRFLCAPEEMLRRLGLGKMEIENDM